MKPKNIFITGAIVIALFVSSVYLYDYLKEDEVVEATLDEKMEEAEFVYQSGYYVRETVQDEITYTESVDVTENNFMRTTVDESDKEVYNYNYVDDTFSYLYYFEEELIMKVTYDYVTAAVVEDDDEQYDNLKTDIDELKVYFEGILTDNDLEVSEL